MLKREPAIIPVRAQFNLRATDTRGTVWVSDGIIPSAISNITGKAMILTGKLKYITSKGKFPSDSTISGSYITYWVFDNLGIPYNKNTMTRVSIVGSRQSVSGTLNSWKFRSNKKDYLLTKEDDDYLKIRISSDDDQLPTNFSNRVIEAFQFILGHPLNWIIMHHVIGHNVELVVRSRRIRIRTNRFEPPLPAHTIQYSKNGKYTATFHKRLFHKYLQYTIEHQKTRHPIWGQLNAIYEAASASFIDAEALTLSVAIESMLLSEFSDIGYPSRKEKDSIDELLAYLQNWNGNEDIKGRVKSMVGNLKKPSATDRMYKLEKKGAINENQIKSWKNLRHPSVHRYLASGKPTPEFRQLIDECKLLFYHLIFHAIGYEGPYTDFSSIGWPLKKYPGNQLWKD